MDANKLISNQYLNMPDTHNDKRKEDYIFYIPEKELLNKPYDKENSVSATDTFISKSGLKMFSSLFSKESDGLPAYIEPYKDFINNVIDIPDSEFEDINKCQIEKEIKKREEEREEEKIAAEVEENELKIKQAIDIKVDSFLRRNRFYVKRTCPVKIPYKSTLTHAEHEFYLWAFIKFTKFLLPENIETKVDEEEYNEYLKLQEKVFHEQRTLMNFSFKVAAMTLSQHYNTVSQPILDYVRQYVSHRCQRALAYPRFYRSELRIPIKPNDQSIKQANFEFKHLGHLLSLGKVNQLNIRIQNARTILARDESIARFRRPDPDNLYNRHSNLFKCPVSEDPNAEFLAKEHKATVVMSASAFKTLVDNQDKFWNIPVVIKSYTIKDENGKDKHLRIIFIDKPLIKKEWYPLQIKSTFFKQSALAYFSKHYSKSYHTPLSQRFSSPLTSNYSDKRENKAYSDDVFGSYNDNNLDQFGHSRDSSFDMGTSPEKTKKDNLKSMDKPSKLLKDNQSKSLKDTDSQSLSLKDSSSVTKDVICNLEEDLFLTDEDDEDDKKILFGQSIQNSGISAPQSNDVPSITKSNDVPSTPKLNDVPSTPKLNDVPSTPKLNDVPSTPKLNDVPLFKPQILEDETVSAQQEISTENEHKKSSSLKYVDDLMPGTKKKLRRIQKRGKHGEKVEKKPWDRTIFTNWSTCKGLKMCPDRKYSNVNVHYQLFSFETNDEEQKEKDEPMRIIVRHNIHGLLRSFKKNSGIESAKALVLKTKLENQLYFGCEVNSLSEVTQQWASLIVRPNTTLMHVRICIESGSVVMAEEQNLDSILKEGEQSHIQFNPQTPLTQLNAIFNSVRKMPSGQYMLHHSAKKAQFLTIMKSCDSISGVLSDQLDLHNIYKDGSMSIREYKTPPWLAIDTCVPTPFHFFHRKIPGTFPMAHDKKLNKQERRRKRILAKNKKSIDDFDNEVKESVKKPEVHKKQEIPLKRKRKYF